jgi:hypothetical protein
VEFAAVVSMFISWQQIVGLFVLAMPIACIARTVVFEEVFREPRDWCQKKSKDCSRLLHRKFFYLFTCEYCFSHYVTFFFLLITHFKLLFPDWRGYLIAFFSLVFVANIYLNLYGRIRLEITGHKKEIEARQKQIEISAKELAAKDREIAKLDLELGKQGE